MALVIFDEHCPLCKALASILSEQVPSDWQVMSQSHFAKQFPSWQDQADSYELQILLGQNLLKGQVAWEYLLQQLPQLKMYRQIAVRLGLSEPKQAKLVRFLGHTFRRLCWQCPNQTR